MKQRFEDEADGVGKCIETLGDFEEFSMNVEVEWWASDSYGPILLTESVARRSEKAVEDSRNLAVGRSRNGHDNNYSLLTI